MMNQKPEIVFKNLDLIVNNKISLSDPRKIYRICVYIHTHVFVYTIFVTIYFISCSVS